jgi:hypothetical protein
MQGVFADWRTTVAAMQHIQQPINPLEPRMKDGQGRIGAVLRLGVCRPAGDERRRLWGQTRAATDDREIDRRWAGGEQVEGGTVA